ncbi:ribonuclease HI family protein [Virgibacillus sp. 179-BFC.A HS]|uniref:Ribonuclease HI family protein n=1 Tax=Tigheibacillus jepli TaxID=3035914 RepID=A0ABU5CMX0_9BACI|nr:ribonuclease HI family protein [Virgibacillus sp. 179-BFC.A HS]MDY0406793.1 ribonuclease HI family protein [Virgibacillus sp. 179-BFC.A HS]
MIIVYTDGASKGNPGSSGAGIYIKANGEIFEYAIPLEKMSNHEAEFQAVIEALKICNEKFAGEILSFRSDSKVVVDTIENDRTKNQSFQPLLTKIREIAGSFPYFFIKWVPEKQNIHADQLAKKAIQMQ